MPPKVVVDANVFISALIFRGIPSTVFSLNARQKGFDFIAPEFLLQEVRKHMAKASRLTKLSQEEFEEAYLFLVGAITFVPAEIFWPYMGKAEELSPDPNDTQYIALALSFGCQILTGDKKLLSMKRPKVVSPRELHDSLAGKGTL